jgi:tripartite-type tricarboxylate transporter receptor subunit TctC
MLHALQRLLALALLCAGGLAQAEFPERPLTMLLPTPPGGVADMNARPVARHLQDLLKQPVVVQAKPGAGGSLAYSSVAKAAPDGYTLLMGLSTISVLPEADRVNGRTPSFELEQLIPVARISADPLLLLVRADAPWQTINELVDDARRRPGQISYASSGNYGAIHFPMEMLNAAAGVKMLHVPYSGGGPALTALMGGQVQVTAAGPAAAKAAAGDGRVRVLASWGGQRIAMFPEVPTLKERGIDAEYYLWAGLFLPAGTPAPVVEQIRGAVRRAAALPAFKEDMDRARIVVQYLDAPEFSAFWKKDAEVMVNLARRIGRLE